MKKTVIVNGIELTAEQVEQAHKELHAFDETPKPVANLAQVVRVIGRIRGIVLTTGPVQKTYTDHYADGLLKNKPFTVVDASGDGSSYRTIEDLRCDWREENWQ